MSDRRREPGLSAEIPAESDKGIIRDVNESQKRERVAVIDVAEFDWSSESKDNHRLEGQMILPGDVRSPLGDIPHWEPEYVYKKIFFKECPIAGLSFHLEHGDDLWFELEFGTKLVLVRDRNNKHDKNAVAVALADDFDGNCPICR